MPMTTTLWHYNAGQPIAKTLEACLWLSASGEAGDQPRPGSVPIVPVHDCPGVLAAVLVPDDLAGYVVINGSPIASGLAATRHADCVEIDGQKFWTSGESSPQETDYSPAKHSADVFCFLTKARLREGEPITICPGPPGRPCGMIYKRAAWQTVVTQSGRFRCPNCSFDPQAPRWTPPIPPPHPSLEDIFRMLSPENER